MVRQVKAVEKFFPLTKRWPDESPQPEGERDVPGVLAVEPCGTARKAGVLEQERRCFRARKQPAFL